MSYDPQNTTTYIQAKGLGDALMYLTRRDYFAAAALQGLIVNSIGVPAESVVRWAIECADLMIKELDK